MKTRNDLPDRYKNQLNGKTATENYNKTKRKEPKTLTEEAIKILTYSFVKAAIDELFADFHFKS